MAKKTTRSTPKPAPTIPEPAPKPRTRTRTSRPKADKSVAKDTALSTLLSPPTRSAPSDDDIRVRAYHRYLERGGAGGSEIDDWLEAKRDLSGRQ
jgi:hypothetical protein